MGSLVEEMKKYDDVDEQTLWWINKALSYSGYPSHVGKQKIKEHIKEIEKMENNKVRQFIDLLVNKEETIENAAKVSGISDMKLVDVLKTISEMEFESIKAFSSAVAGMNSMKEAIQTVKDVDDALVDLKKNKEDNELTQEELRDLLKERTQKEKQIYIANVTGIDKDVLSRFKLGKIDLYPRLFTKLEAYLTNS